MSDPICHIPPVAPTPGRPTVTIPPIPQARPDVNSLLATVNALRQAVLILSGAQTTTGQNKGNEGGFFNGFTSGSSNKGTQWSEQSRAVEKVRIFQNDDKTSENWVDVERINSLTMVDKNTKQTWKWDYKRKG